MAGDRLSVKWPTARKLAKEALAAVPAITFALLLLTFLAWPRSDTPHRGNAFSSDSDSVALVTPELHTTPSLWTPRRLDSLYKHMLLMADSTVDTTGRHIYTEQWQAFKYGEHYAMRDSFFVITGGENWGDTCIYTVIAPGVTRDVPDTMMIFNRCNGSTAPACTGYIGDADYTYYSLCDSIRVVGDGIIDVVWSVTDPPALKRTITVTLVDTIVTFSTHAVFKTRWTGASTYTDSTTTRWMALDYYQNTVSWLRPLGRQWKIVGVAWAARINGTSIGGGYSPVDVQSSYVSAFKGLMVSWVTNPASRTALNDKTKLSFWQSDLSEGLQPAVYTHIGTVELEDADLAYATIGTNAVLLTISVWIQNARPGI